MLYRNLFVAYIIASNVSFIVLNLVLNKRTRWQLLVFECKLKFLFPLELQHSHSREEDTIGEDEGRTRKEKETPGSGTIWESREKNETKGETQT